MKEIVSFSVDGTDNDGEMIAYDTYDLQDAINHYKLCYLDLGYDVQLIGHTSCNKDTESFIIRG